MKIKDHILSATSEYKTELTDVQLDQLEKYYELLRRADYMHVSGIYHLSLYRRKGFHPYRDADGEFEGALVEVEDDGHLILHDRQGRRRICFSWKKRRRAATLSGTPLSRT